MGDFVDTAPGGANPSRSRLEIERPDGTRISIETTPESLREIVADVLAATGVGAAERKMATRPTTDFDPSDPIAFVAGSRAKTHIDHCLVLGLWLEDVARQPRWKPAHLAEIFERLPGAPQNISDLLAKSERRGNVQRDERGWYLSDSGRGVVRRDLLGPDALLVPRSRRSSGA